MSGAIVDSVSKKYEQECTAGRFVLSFLFVKAVAAMICVSMCESGCQTGEILKALPRQCLLRTQLSYCSSERTGCSQVTCVHCLHALLYP